MLSEELNLWIAQSESWQTFVDFRHSEESVSSYPFLKRPDDFYISLFGSLGKILENSELETEKILSVAKGLEIYSLQTKRDTFQGVDQANNILFAAGLYYLANYAPSASILANIYNFNNYDEDIEKFLLSFLNRKKIEKNIYRDILDEYLEIGDEGYLDKLITIIQEKKEFYFKFNPHLFFLYLLSEKILLKFKKNNIWIDLLGVNNDKFFWEKYIEKSITKKFPVWDFFPSQKQALDKGILGDFKAISLQTPTSSGKTAISELLIYNEVKRNPEGRILYLAPFRALASELKQSFGKNLEKLSIKSKTIYGGNIPTLEEKKSIQDVQLLISTPEKFMAIENVDSDFAEGFSMIICDEGHLLGEMGNRGLSYELLLARFRKDEGKKFVFLSAIVPNIKDINAWLGGKEENIVESSYRATEIEYAFLRKSGSRYNLEINPFQKIPKKYILNNFLTETDNLDKTELSKSTTIALKALNGGSVALFAPTKGPQGVNGLGKKLISQISKNTSLYSDSDLKENPQEKKNLKEYFKIIFGENYLLTQIIDYGILLHHGDLPQNVREKIEDYFRDEKIKLIICNTTLAEGVNLPIRTIVVHTTKWFNPENQKQEQLNVSDLKNLFGRAGRAGKETKGLIIIPNEKDFDIVKKVIEDLKLDSLKGYLYENIKNIHRIITQKKIIITNEILNSQNEEFKKLTDIIDKSIIDLLEEIIDPENIENQIQELIKNTFAFHQANEEEKLTLNTLIQLRGKAIKKSIQDNKFHFIKKSGSNLRLYEELENKLDIENALWMETTKPNDDNWLNFVLKILFSLPQIQYGLEKFNEKEIGGIIKESDFRKEHLPFRHLIEPYLERKNSYYLVKESYLLDSFIEIKDFPKELMKILQKKKEEKDKYLKTDDIKNVIKLWLEGKWFEDIAKEICNNDIDMSLRLINQFLGFNLQTIISTIVHLVDLKLQENNKQISPTILNFPEYLQYGLQNKNELDLIELGFTDRIGILALSEYFNGINYVYQEINELKIYLIGNKSNIIDSVKVKIPNIVLMEIRKSFEYL